MIMDEGWTKDIKAYDDMKEAIQKLRTDEQGVIIWNTMSLKWLMRKYKTDNLVINPIEPSPARPDRQCLYGTTCRRPVGRHP